MPSDDAQKTLGHILTASADYLKKRNIDSPRIAAELLAARLLKCRRLDLQGKLNAALPEKIVDAMRRGVMRVGNKEPVQYVLGQWDFRGITLKTDARALIPRPETEQLVQLVLDHAAFKANAAPRVMDYGTGSGCIALSIAHECPAAKLIAVDVSADALALAQENADALGLSERVSFCNLAEIDIGDVLDPGTIDVIVSNPPYIPTAMCDRLDRSVKDFEPRQALDGGSDGMDITKTVIEESTMLLASGGLLFLEVDAADRQPQKLAEFLAEIGFEDICIHKDAYGKDRFISARLAEGV